MAKRSHCVDGAFCLLWSQFGFAQTLPSFSPDALAFFSTKVRPLLKNNCDACHNANNKAGGLSFESRESVLKGGADGPAANPGKPEESLLVQAVEHKGSLKMPMGKPQLADADIAILRQWVAQQLPWAAEDNAGKPHNWDHWAFQPPVRPAIPTVARKDWVRNPIDNFILARLEREKLQPSPQADRATLLRRVSLDLTGLPPTPDEMAAFLNDKSPKAYEKVVDRLLASPHYGERWGRHWLDAARYADSDGYSIDAPRPIWKYRDWVINAFNKDMPFTQFTIEQIAGDLLPNPTVDQLIATGFQRNTPANFEGGIDFEEYRNEAVADRVATTGSAFLGLTIGCARCHDHKYDPILQKDFYRLFAYYNNTTEITKQSERGDFYRPYIDLPTPQESADAKSYWEKATQLSKEVMDEIEQLQSQPRPADAPPIYKDPELTKRVAALRSFMEPLGIPGAPEYHWSKPWVTRALVMRELPQPRETYVQLGGNFLRHADRVYPGVPAVLTQFRTGPPVAGNRLDLAKWLVDPSNPLTARVIVNRMWQEYFGKGIVETQDDFGLIGVRPSHQELLDWLATEFVARGWSQKTIHRIIVTSATYMQSSKERPELEEADPYNKLLARQNRLRLDAEIIRDSALVASGLLTPTIGGPPVHPPIPPNAMSGTQIKRPWNADTGPDRYRRGIYTFFFRSMPAAFLGLFDAPDGTQSCTRRIRSDSPLQSLTLLNDEAFLEFAGALAERIEKEGGASDQDRLNYAYLLTLGRKPMARESDRLLKFLAQQRQVYTEDSNAGHNLLSRPGMTLNTDATPAQAAEFAAWTSVGRVLLNLDDFMTRE
ncbi:MAG TPA: PSD1 and planctomycete cytochrome C domain-containing protein [Bryobacteraceae bacterium]|nr:PSD1 and planctomycete cytochrome C domain-containing protein [Bryobacteraceae bacterium]